MKYSILVVGLIVIVFALFQLRTPDLIGTYDTYWHAQYSYQNIANFGIRGLISNPLEYAGFLFQSLLALFSLFVKPLLASKLVGIILAGALFGLVAFIAQRMKVALVWLWPLLLLLGAPEFSLRLLFVRTYLLSIILLLLGIYALMKKQNYLLFITAIIYGLSYIGAPLLIGAAFVFTAVDWAYSSKRDFRFVYISTAGVLLGFTLNPTFPGVFGNLIHSGLPTFGWLHKLEGELNGYPFLTLLNWQFVLFFSWLSSLFLSVRQAWGKKLNSNILFLQLLAIISFGGMMYAQRFIEYWAPITVLAIAFTYTSILKSLQWCNIRDAVSRYWEVRFASVVVILVILLFGLRGFAFLNYYGTPGNSFTDYRNVGAILASKVAQGGAVFNVNWLEYPKLYLWSPNTNYLVKIGGHVLYFNDPELYELWSKIAADDVSDMTETQLYNTIKYRASSDYLIFENQSNQLLQSKLENNSEQFRLLYNDGNVSLYELIDKHNLNRL